jgi:hypothetical protein
MRPEQAVVATPLPWRVGRLENQMNGSKSLVKPIACVLVALLAAPVGGAQAPGNKDQAPLAAESQTQPQIASNGAGAAASLGQASDSAQSSGQQQPNGGANPVGTAVAPAPRTTGVAGSRPAGAVIAPAKQRRVKIFLIKVAVVVGAGVAVGTVLALSHSSPSRP